MRVFVALAALALVLSGAVAGTAQAASPDVVISELRFRGPAGAADELIELYNRSTVPVPIGGLLIRGSNNAGTVSTRATITANTILGAGCHYLVTGATYSGAVPGDQTFSTGVTDDGGIAVTTGDQATIIDAVGLSTGSAFKEGTPLASLGAANTNHSYERKPGGGSGSGVDTDDNSADFQAITPSDPQNLLSTCIGSTTPTGPTGSGAATPNTVEAGGSTLLTVAVRPGANPASTGLAVSVDLAPIGGGSGQPLFDDGTHGDAAAGDGTFSFDATVDPATTAGTKSLAAAITDEQGRSGSASIALTVATPAPVTGIHTIQGASQVSPLSGQLVRNVQGIVTGVRSNGFYMQDPSPDTDAETSEGIFVFTSSAPAVAVGDLARVDGRISEFIPGGASSGNLPTTELSGSLTVGVLSHGNALPAPVHAAPPTTVIEDDANGDVRNGQTFDPDQDGLDYWESLEGMRVQVDNPVAVGPQTSFGELPVVDDTPSAGPRTPRGGVLLTPTDGNPERVILDDQILPTPPVANVGDHFDGPAVGVLDYNFGNFMLELTQPLVRVDSGLQREITAAATAQQLSIATFNVENLAPSDGATKFDGLANRIVENLRSPKIVTLEEVQDNSGATDDGTVESNVTLDTLVAAIERAGGPHYSYTYVAPVDDQDGGQPGGNIRIAFLYDEAAGVSLPAGATKGGSTEAESVVTDAAGRPHLALDPGRVDPTNPAWTDSRKPLAGEFVFRGQTIFVIGNHFNSKGGDDPLMGRFQPPVRSSETQRHQQAQVVHDFVGSILAADPTAKIVVLGDLNDFQFSDTVHILEGATPILGDMIDTLPENERYSYEFEGNAQVLDHVLVSDGVTQRTLDVVHINAEFADQLSDHDPSVLRLLVNDAPTASAGGPYTVPEGGSTTLTATGADPNGDALQFAWDFDGDGNPDATGQTVTFDAAQLDGPAEVPVTVTVSDGASSTVAHATVHVENVAPTATFHAPAQALTGFTFDISLTDPTDPSVADRGSLTFAFDCGSGFGAFGAEQSRTCTAGSVGTQTVAGRIRDKDGGVTTYTAQVHVTVTAESLCTLTVRYVQSSSRYQGLPPLARKVADALAQAACAQLGVLPAPTPARKATAVKAYERLVSVLEAGGWLTAEQAATLTRAAGAL